jgi:hypothetical protein
LEIAESSKAASKLDSNMIHPGLPGKVPLTFNLVVIPLCALFKHSLKTAAAEPKHADERSCF